MMHNANRISTSQIAFVTTYKCNLNCGYCFVQEKESPEMTLETMRLATDVFYNYLFDKSKIAEFLFSGGEPLLSFDLMRTYVNYIKSEKRFEKFKFHITTNGIDLDDEKISFMKENNFQICLSLDGTLESSLNRFGKQVGKYHKLIELVNDISRFHKDSKDFFRVRMTISPDRAKHLIDDIKFLIANKVSTIHFSPDYESNWTEDNVSDFINQYKEIADLKQNNSEISIDPFDSKGLNFFTKRGCYQHDCSTLLTVIPSGDFYYCPRYAGRRMNLLGNIHKPIEIIKNLRDMLKKHENIFTSSKSQFICPCNFDSCEVSVENFKLFDRIYHGNHK